MMTPERRTSMDLNKIGKFISEERKKKNYTQKQLADILNVSDRTISKWECGKGFPEISLLQPLCEELGVFWEKPLCDIEIY